MTWRPICLAVLLVAIGPAAAPVMATGPAALGEQRPGVVDAYVIVAALDTDPVFNREAREAGRVLAQRFDAEGRTIILAEDEGASFAEAAGTPATLASALARVAARMDRDEDVLILYTTSHGSPRAGLNYDSASAQAGVITPPELAAMLSRNGFQNQLIILQACFSGQFVPALASARTVVVTAASSLTTSFGCSAGNDWTFFGHALVNLAMRRQDSFLRQFRRAVVTIIGWEEKLRIEPSNPQISVGKDSGAWLSALDARAGAVPANPVGKPPSELTQ